MALGTAGGTGLDGLAYAAALAAAVQGVRNRSGELEDALRPPRPVAVGLTVAVAIPSLAGLVAPGVLHALERRPDAIRDGHEAWRLLTAAVVQDGGVLGTAFNLAALLVVGAVAARVWRGRVVAGAFVLAAMAGNVAATWWFSTTGAGSSLATFALAAGTLGWVAAADRDGRPLVAAGVVAALGALLVATGDGHGVAFLAGLLAGAVAAVVRAVVHTN